MRALFLSTLALLTLTIAGCETIKVEDGRVPAAYLDAALIYQGTYQGSFNNIPGTLTIAFDNDKPSILYQNEFGTDILDPTCKSQIGQLTQLSGKKSRNETKLHFANFAFSPGECADRVQGRDFKMTFRQDSYGNTWIEVSILRETVRQRRCTWHPEPNGGGYEDCQDVYVDFYLNGKFNKVN